MIFCKINIISLDLHAFRAKSVKVGVKKRIEGLVIVGRMKTQKAVAVAVVV